MPDTAYPATYPASEPMSLRPPFYADTAARKARMAEDAWNTRDPGRVSLAFTEDSAWRNRSESFSGRPATVLFLREKWAFELECRLIKEVRASAGDRIAARFAYEWHDADGAWFRSHGNERWEFAANGLTRRREASINDVPVATADRPFLWPPGPRPVDQGGLSDLGL